MQIYDLKCSRCGQQLNFVETADEDGDTLILVDPCPICSQDEDVREAEG